MKQAKNNIFKNISWGEVSSPLGYGIDIQITYLLNLKLYKHMVTYS